MGMPSARIGDMHVCPMVNPGPVPHVGGPISIGAPTVLIGGIPAARIGDMAVCTGPPDVVCTGSAGVIIAGKPAARLGDSTAHGGKVVAGCPTVLIGGAGGGGGGAGGGGAGGNVGAAAYSSATVASSAMTVGSTLGNPTSALSSFNNLANTRTSGSVQQTFGNCGIESARQIMDASTGNPGNEVAVLQAAINNGNAIDDPNNPLNRGGTYPSDIKNILANNGVSAHLENQTPANIRQAVIEGKGVITGHDAGKLWGDPRYAGGGHAVLVTGVEYDNTGAVTKYIINDTGTGQGMRSVPAAQFEQSLFSNMQITVTDNPVW